MHNKPPTQAYGPTINRVSDLMAHTQRYAFKGVSRLAHDARLSPSSVSRLINGKLNPSFLMIARLTTAIERQLGFQIDPRDLVAENGTFLTRYVCDLTSCPGCLPENAMDEFGDLKPTFLGVQPGQWETSRFPNGFKRQKGESV